MNESRQTMRTFVALSLPHGLHDGVARIQSRLRYLAGASAIRWTRPEQLHLTLEFLGDMDASRTSDLIEVVRTVCADEAILKLEITGAGCFPSFAKPSVVWLGVAGETVRLAALQKRIRENVREFVERGEDHPFSPHLTIGRVKNGAYKTARVFGKALQSEMTKLGSCGEWIAARVEIMRSDMSAAGSVYSELGHIELNGVNR